MLIVNVPIGEFIRRAIEASLYCNYTAFLSIIARTADGNALQSELLKNWDSFNDLTHNLILVLSPNPLTKDSRNAHVVSGDWERKGLVSEGLWFNHEIPSRLEHSFSYREGYESDDLGYYSSRRPGSTKDNKFALTSAATETARFFGLSEAWIPCVVILSIQEKAVFFICLNEESSFYNLTRSILINYEPYAREVENIKINRSNIDRILASKKLTIHKCIQERKKALHSIKIIGQEWLIQRENICNLLLDFSKRYLSLAVDAHFFINYLHEKEEKMLDISSKVDSFLTQVQECQASSLSEERAIKRICNNLKRAIKKVHKIDEHRETWELKKVELQEKVRRLELEIVPLESEIVPLKREFKTLCDLLKIKRKNNKFSNAIFAAIKEDNNYNFSQEDVTINLPECLKVWQTTLLKQQSSSRYLEENSQRFTTQTRTEYQINGTNVFVNSPIRRNVMNEGDTYNVYGQAAAVGKKSKSDYNTFIQSNPAYFQELKNEVRQLLDELNKENAKESQVIEEIRAKIKYDVPFKDRLINAVKEGGIEAVKAIFDHPFINVPIETVKGFIEAEARK